MGLAPRCRSGADWAFGLVRWWPAGALPPRSRPALGAVRWWPAGAMPPAASSTFPSLSPRPLSPGSSTPTRPLSRIPSSATTTRTPTSTASAGGLTATGRPVACVSHSPPSPSQCALSRPSSAVPPRSTPSSRTSTTHCGCRVPRDKHGLGLLAELGNRTRLTRKAFSGWAWLLLTHDSNTTSSDGGGSADGGAGPALGFKAAVRGEEVVIYDAKLGWRPVAAASP